MSKNYNQAPLPFQGQKRRWNTEFKKALKQFDDCTVFVDLFGGSGLLSHMVHQVYPNASVIYNDFDDYHKRINSIDRTNCLLSDLREILKYCESNKLIQEPYRSLILKRIQTEEQTGYVDYITLSSSLLFSMNYATNYTQLSKQPMYNCIRLNNYNAEGYLDGLEIVKQDYFELYKRWRGFPNVCFLVDPPYLSTEAKTYTGYWKLKDYLDVLHTLKDTNYFYFTSNKSNIVELCDWMQLNYAAANPFRNAKKVEIVSHMNYSSKYVDIMLYKHE